MSYTFHDLKHKRIADLRNIASELDHEAVKGYTQLNKDHLLEALSKALGIDVHEHHDVTGIDKAAIKVQIRGLKKDRDAALEARDHAQLRLVRRQIHGLKHTIRRHTV